METVEELVKFSPRKKGAFTAPFEFSQILSSLSQFHILSQKKVKALLAIPLPCQLKKQMVGNLGKVLDFKAPIRLCRDQHLCHSGKNGCDRLVLRKQQN